MTSKDCPDGPSSTAKRPYGVVIVGIVT